MLLSIRRIRSLGLMWVLNVGGGFIIDTVVLYQRRLEAIAKQQQIEWMMAGGREGKRKEGRGSGKEGKGKESAHGCITQKCVIQFCAMRG